MIIAIWAVAADSGLKPCPGAAEAFIVVGNRRRHGTR
jgi:hypothetical protein